MNTRKLVARLSKSAVVREELPLQLQLGIPRLERKNGRICLSFLPHREVLRNGNYEVYPALYEIAWVYPFEHLAWFHNLSLERVVNADMWVKLIDEGRMLTLGVHCMMELYAQYDKTFSWFEQHGELNDTMFNACQAKYHEAVQCLELEPLYLTKGM